jgi:hypothetical protein
MAGSAWWSAWSPGWCSSLVAYHAEHSVNPEFATVGDACGGASSP